MAVQLGISGHNIIAVYINRIKFDSHSEVLNIPEKNYVRPEPRFVSVDVRWGNQTLEVAMSDSEKPRRVKAKITCLVIEIAIVDLDRNGNLAEYVESVEEIEHVDVIDLHNIHSVISHHD